MPLESLRPSRRPRADAGGDRPAQRRREGGDASRTGRSVPTARSAHLEWSARPLADEGLVYAAARDVTDRRRTERELEQFAAEQAALRRVATLVARDASPAEVLEAVVGEVRTPARRELDAAVPLRGRRRRHGRRRRQRAGTEIPIGRRCRWTARTARDGAARTGRAARQRTFDGASGPMVDLRAGSACTPWWAPRYRSAGGCGAS